MNELKNLAPHALATHSKRTVMCRGQSSKYHAKYDTYLSSLLAFALVLSLTWNLLPPDFCLAVSLQSTTSYPKYYHLFTGVLPDNPM